MTLEIIDPFTYAVLEYINMFLFAHENWISEAVQKLYTVQKAPGYEGGM